ncbi:putative quinol monooxygenase [Paraburkholderia sediminicola]|uniref:putative quinol monooxygenase n=1 Tax=Paraburkholderia sediminicola TaxID=458836 RepID=UPI0038B715D7
MRYELLQDEGDPRRFVLVEHWSDATLREKHHTQGEHILNFHAHGVNAVEKQRYSSSAGLHERATPCDFASSYGPPIPGERTKTRSRAWAVFAAASRRAQ